MSDLCLCPCKCKNSITVDEGFCLDCAMGVFGSESGPECGFFGEPNIKNNYKRWFENAIKGGDE